MSAEDGARRRWSAWLRPVAAWGTVPLCVSVVTWGLDRTVAALAPVLLVVAATALVMRRPGGRHELRWWCLVAGASASAALSLAVAAAVSSWLAVAAVASLALTAPPARARLSALSGAGAAPPHHSDAAASVSASTGAASEATPAGSWVADVDTSQLCHLWRATFWTVRDLHDPERALHVVELRQAVLDELERRHPDEVDRWLSSGHHVADGPSRYL